MIHVGYQLAGGSDVPWLCIREWKTVVRFIASVEADGMHSSKAQTARKNRILGNIMYKIYWENKRPLSKSTSSMMKSRSMAEPSRNNA